MSNEKFKPKLPIYDEQGKVRDERIAREMAHNEIVEYEDLKGQMPGFSDAQYRQAAGEYAEDLAKETYDRIGVEVPWQEVPRAVLEAFKEYMRSQGSFEDKEFEDPRLEFRKIESTGGSTTYRMFDYGRESRKSPLLRLWVDSEGGKVGKVRGHHSIDKAA